MSTCEKDSKPTPPRDERPIDCTTNACPANRNFILVYGEPGLGHHNLGENPKRAARTHEREVRANAFPGVPPFGVKDWMSVAGIKTVGELVSLLQVGNVVYLAYFGHSSPDALLIGEGSVPDSNLTNFLGPNNTPVRALPPSKFRTDAQVRLFGCRSAYRRDPDPRFHPIAELIALHLHVRTFGYAEDGGSIFTTDRKLGHGERDVTQLDRATPPGRKASDVWMVPIRGRPVFTPFGP